MQKLWFTADLHLGHGNIVKYCNRPFLSEAELERVESEGRRGWREKLELGSFYLARED